MSPVEQDATLYFWLNIVCTVICIDKELGRLPDDEDEVLKLHIFRLTPVN